MSTEALRVTEALGAEGATDPRISLEYMESQIGRTYYVDGQTLARSAFMIDTKDKVLAPSSDLQVFTICMMVLKSGFIVIGKSAPMSAANYNKQKGCTFAYEDAIRELWPLFAFAVKQGKVSP